MSELTLADRATIANMSPEYGATMGFFPVDRVTLQYLRMTGRDEKKVKNVHSFEVSESQASSSIKLATEDFLYLGGMWFTLVIDSRVSSDQSRFEQVEEIEAYLRANDLFIDHDAVSYVHLCMIHHWLYCNLRMSTARQ